jgi:hypothetical protein
MKLIMSNDSIFDNPEDQTEYKKFQDNILKPEVRQFGTKIVVTRKEKLYRREELGGLLGDFMDLMIEGDSINFTINSSKTTYELLNLDNYLDICTAAEVQFVVKYHSEILSNIMKLGAKESGESEVFDHYKTLIEKVSGLLKKIRFRAEFRSIDDLPIEIKVLMNKYIPYEIRVHKAILGEM